jgi:hypothetical protein
MSRCRECGEEAGYRERICYDCAKKWRDRRLAAFKQAEGELGVLDATNHKAYIRRVKELERIEDSQSTEAHGTDAT